MEITAKHRFSGLDGTRLKLIAMLLMVLDHIHYMFVDFAPIPDWFTILGRLVAPVFLFLLVEGFTHTHDRRRYFLRVWAVAAGMGAVSFCMRVLGWWQRADGFIPINGIFMNFPLLFCMWQGMDWLEEKRYLPGLAALALPWLWPDLSSLVLTVLARAGLEGPWQVLRFACFTVLPRMDLITDGGPIYILEGMVLYLFRRRRRLQIAAYAATAFALEFCYYGYLYNLYYAGFTWGQMFTNVDYCQWLSVFSVFLMLLYNGQRGRGLKQLFYLFYPAHVYVLYALSCALYPLA